MALQVGYQTFREKKNTKNNQMSRKLKKEGICSNSFYNKAKDSKSKVN